MYRVTLLVAQNLAASHMEPYKHEISSHATSYFTTGRPTKHGSIWQLQYICVDIHMIARRQTLNAAKSVYSRYDCTLLNICSLHMPKLLEILERSTQPLDSKYSKHKDILYFKMEEVALVSTYYD